MPTVFRTTQPATITVVERRHDSAEPDAHQDALDQIRDWLDETERQEQLERAWEAAWDKLVADWKRTKAAERDAFRARITRSR
jgi:hypothetical protein